MTTATVTSTPVAPVAPVESPVDALIREAGAAEGTMYSKAREAAKLAAPELDGTIANVADRIKAVVARHSNAFSAVGHNVKAIFSDTLWLLAQPALKVEIPVAGAPKDKPQSATVSASDALTMSKNILRDVAKQVREQSGASTNRTGRTSSTVTNVTPATSANAATIAPVNTFFDELLVRIGKPEDFAKIVAVLEQAGYTVKAKAGKVLPKAATPAPAVGTIAADILKATNPV